MIPSTAEKDRKCRITDQKMNGNTVNWSIECDHSEGEGTITY